MLRHAIQSQYCAVPADADPMFRNLRMTPEYADIRAAGRACQSRFLQERIRPKPE